MYKNPDGDYNVWEQPDRSGGWLYNRDKGDKVPTSGWMFAGENGGWYPDTSLKIITDFTSLTICGAYDVSISICT